MYKPYRELNEFLWFCGGRQNERASKRKREREREMARDFIVLDFSSPIRQQVWLNCTAAFQDGSSSYRPNGPSNCGTRSTRTAYWNSRKTTDPPRLPVSRDYSDPYVKSKKKTFHKQISSFSRTPRKKNKQTIKNTALSRS